MPSLHKSPLLILAVAAWLALLGSGPPGLALAHDAWSLVNGDFQSRDITLLALDDHGIQFTDSSSAEPQRAPWDQLLELDHSLPPGPRADKPAFALHLNGGDLINGDPVAIADDKISWRAAQLGQVDLPEDRVNAIVRAGVAVSGLDEPRKADSVRLLNGDVTAGVIQGLDHGAITIVPAGVDSPARIDLEKVAAILLADADPLAAPSTRAFRVWLTDGSSLTVPLVTLAESGAAKVTIGLAARRTATIDLSAVSCIEQTNGPVRWLTGLTPSQVDYHPYLDQRFPPLFDHPVDNASVTIRQQYPPFHHGIGVHSYTRLTYAAPPGCARFRTQYAIERIAGADMSKADVTVRLILDGKTVREYAHVRYGTTADPVEIDLDGARELSLEVDYGDNLDAEDRFVWLDPAFLGAGPSTNPN